MAKNNFPKKYFLVPLGLIIIASIFLVIFESPRDNNQIQEQTPEIFRELTSWKNDVIWATPKDTTQNTYLGEIKGKQTSANIKVNEPNIAHFENSSYMESHGYTVDNNLSADGPGSSSWGYTKTNGSQVDIVIFSYNVPATSSDPNTPLEFNCPCDAELQVFIGSVENKNQSNLSNPASQNCTEKGGTLSIETRGDGGEYGLCNFEDNMSCEEWALYRGECPVGGVKTTGFDTIDQMYCAWLGGQTLAVENSNCTLPNGNTCTTLDLYNGKCS